MPDAAIIAANTDLLHLPIRVNGARVTVAAFLAMDMATVETVDARGFAEDRVARCVLAGLGLAVVEGTR